MCRTAYDGHGYLVASGLVRIENYLNVVCSAACNNVVLFQQTARYSPSLTIKNQLKIRFVSIKRYLLKAIQQKARNKIQTLHFRRLISNDRLIFLWI